MSAPSSPLQKIPLLQKSGGKPPKAIMRADRRDSISPATIASPLCVEMKASRSTHDGKGSNTVLAIECDHAEATLLNLAIR
jgi:hypothetical protein